MFNEYIKVITSDKNHNVNLRIGVKEGKLLISCHYYVNYFITKYEAIYSLEQLIAKSDYYKQKNKSVKTKK